MCTFAEWWALKIDERKNRLGNRNIKMKIASAQQLFQTEFQISEDLSVGLQLYIVQIVTQQAIALGSFGS